MSRYKGKTTKPSPELTAALPSTPPDNAAVPAEEVAAEDPIDQLAAGNTDPEPEGADAPDESLEEGGIEEPVIKPVDEKQEETVPAAKQEEAAASIEVAEATVKIDPKDLTVGSTAASSEVISTSVLPPDPHPGLVRIRIAYPEGYTGARYMKQGSIQPVSEEVAAQLISAGIAERVDE